MNDNAKIIKALLLEMGGLTIGICSTIIAVLVAFHWWGSWGIMGVVVLLVLGGQLGAIEDKYIQWKIRRRRRRG